MSELTYEQAPVPVRDALTAAHRRAWARLAAPGTWLTGAERTAIMAEVRHVPQCALCRQQKAALSPYAIDGAHNHLGALPEVQVDVIHRVISDPGRLTPDWFASVTGDRLSVERYVETIGVLAQTVAIDTFARGIGQDPLPLPKPVAGEPSGYRPEGIRQEEAWVPWLTPETVNEAERQLMPRDRPVANIRRAMSLVPAEALGFFDIVEAQYLAGREMRDFEHEFRAINHAQIELVAGRVSALNGCVY